MSTFTPAQNSARHFAMAKEFLGVKEVPGPKSNPIIAGFFKSAPSWLDQDDSKTAWCGIFRGHIGYALGTGVPKNHFRAIEWATWGKAVPLSKAIQGDTVVLPRTGGNHVALFSHFSNDGKYAYLLGGNQSDAVTVARYPVERIKHVRRG